MADKITTNVIIIIISRRDRYNNQRGTLTTQLEIAHPLD